MAGLCALGDIVQFVLNCVVQLTGCIAVGCLLKKRKCTCGEVRSDLCKQRSPTLGLRNLPQYYCLMHATRRTCKHVADRRCLDFFFHGLISWKHVSVFLGKDHGITKDIFLLTVSNAPRTL